jgi:hypothetical protein
VPVATPTPVVTPAPVPAQKPVATQVASAPAAAPVAAPTSNAAAYVQLSSQRSEKDAATARDDIQRRFGSLFGNSQLEIKRADLGERGIYYRVVLPAQSIQNAGQICSSVKANGGDCFVPGN